MKRLVRRQKLVEYRKDGARGDLGGRELSEDEAEPAALTCRAEHRAHLVENKSAAHVNGYVLAADTKFPLEKPRAVQALTDAIVFEQFVRRSRSSATFEVARRSYYGQLLHRPQGYGDHVALQRVAQADAGIESAGDDIAEIVVDRDIERDLRVALAERGEARLNQNSVRDVRGVDAQQAMWALGEISHLLYRIANLSQCGRERADQLRPGLGERDTAGRAVEQAYVQLRFELLDRLRDRRGRHGELFCRARKAEMPRHAFERDQCGQVNRSSSSCDGAHGSGFLHRSDYEPGVHTSSKPVMI